MKKTVAIKCFEEYPFFDDEDFKVSPPVIPSIAESINTNLELIKEKRRELQLLFGINLD